MEEIIENVLDVVTGEVTTRSVTNEELEQFKVLASLDEERMAAIEKVVNNG